MAKSSQRSSGLFGSTQTERETFRAHTGDSGTVADGHCEYETNIAGLSQGHMPASANSRSLYDDLMDISAGTVGSEAELYQMRSCWPISLNHAQCNTYNIQELDAANHAMLEPTCVLSNSTYFSNSQLGQQSITSPLINKDQSWTVVTPRPDLPLQTSKSHVGSSAKSVQDVKLIDGEVVLWLLYKYISSPTMEDVENIAKDTDYPFEFVIDSYCQYRKSGGMDHAASNKPVTVSQSKPRSRALHTRKSGITMESAYGTQTEEPIIREGQPPNKRARLDGIPATESEQFAVQYSQTSTYHCRQCNKTFNRRSDLRRHIRTHAPGELHCPYNGCGKVFNRKDKLNDHWRRWHGDNTFEAKASSFRRDNSDQDPDSNGQSDKGNSFGGNSPPPNAQNRSSSSSLATSYNSTTFGNCYIFQRGFMNGGFYLRRKLTNIFRSDFSTWRAIRNLGHDDFALVYKVSINHGMEGKNPMVVATKVIRIPKVRHNEVIERAQNEISVLQLLDHEYIIKLAGAYALADRVFINTSLVAECNITKFLSKHSFTMSIFDKTKLLKEVAKVASAIAHIHNHISDADCIGWHMDLKPDNILVTLDTEARSISRFLICGFGNPNILGSNSSVARQVRPATPRYCAPELANGQIGQAADIWSLGCVLAEVFIFLLHSNMQEFEIFASKSAGFKNKWTYSDIFPVLIEWLKSVSSNRSRLACPKLRDDLIDLITEMLRLNPYERPSAEDVVGRLQIMGDVRTTLTVDLGTNNENDTNREDDAFFRTLSSESRISSSSIRMEEALEYPANRDMAQDLHFECSQHMHKPQRLHGLLPLYEPSSDIHTVDVVVLHGPNDNLWEKWIPDKLENSTWLKHFLSKAMPMARSLAFVSDISSNSGFTRGEVNSNVKDDAQNLLKCLRELREERVMRPIVLICHNIGELIIKEALLYAQKNSNFSSLFKAISNVIFLRAHQHGISAMNSTLPLESFGYSVPGSYLSASCKDDLGLALRSFLAPEVDSDLLLPVKNGNHLKISGVSTIIIPMTGDYISELTTVLRKVTGLLGKGYTGQDSQPLYDSPVILKQHLIDAPGSIVTSPLLFKQFQSGPNQNILDQRGRYSVVKIKAQIHGMFFLLETGSSKIQTVATQSVPNCYRRNLFQISGSVTSPNGPVSVCAEEGQAVSIVSQELSISAIESINGDIVKLIVVPWKTPAPNSTKTTPNQEQEPLPILLGSNTIESVNNEATVQTISWRRLRFRVATANNGRRTELQQCFMLRLNLTATLADNTKLCIAQATSGPIVVRGRSSRNFMARKDTPPIGGSAASHGQAAQSSHAIKKRPFPLLSSNVPPPPPPKRLHGVVQAGRAANDLKSTHCEDIEDSALDMAKGQAAEVLV